MTMQDWEEMEDLDSLGEEIPGLEGAEGEAPAPSASGSALPLVQAALCVLALLGLLYLRYVGHPAYDAIAALYHQEMAQEIALPQWELPKAPAPPENKVAQEAGEGASQAPSEGGRTPTDGLPSHPRWEIQRLCLP